jgi:peptidyl-prolyl cis-trans isomerase C
MNRLVLLGIATLAGLMACTQKEAGKVDNVATVNGKPISRNTFNRYVLGVLDKPAADLPAEQRAELLDNLIRAEVVAADAEKAGLQNRDETRAVMELSRLTVLQRAASEVYLKDRKPTDTELRAEYDVQIAAMPRTQYRARHILVNTKEFAESVIRQLERGAAFDKLAAKESIDTGSKEKGGDLDWATPDRMVAPFAEALKSLKKGEYTHVPVQTQFGWHVIRLEDTRESAPPPFESVKDRLIQIVETRKFSAHTDELLAKAKVVKTL